MIKLVEKKMSAVLVTQGRPIGGRRRRMHLLSWSWRQECVSVTLNISVEKEWERERESLTFSKRTAWSRVVSSSSAQRTFHPERLRWKERRVFYFFYFILISSNSRGFCLNANLNITHSVFFFFLNIIPSFLKIKLCSFMRNRWVFFSTT